jgi:hypothetical protein
MFQFKRNYFVIFLVLLLAEIEIALFSKHPFIRPFLGDILVVILLYCLLQSFLKIKKIISAVIVLLISFVVESLQYFHVADWLGLEPNSFWSIVIGTHFSFWDLVCYISGILLVLLIEKLSDLKRHR